MRKLLVAVDFSKTTAKVAEQAIALARGLNAKVWIVHVTRDKLQAATYENVTFYGPAPEFCAAPLGDVEMARELCAEEYRREHEALLGLSEQMRQAGVAAQALLLKGSAPAQILEQAEHRDADMIIMGSHGHGMLHKMLVGSVTEAVLRDALCNVLIVPPPTD